jgi:hypothetical protein
MVNELRRGRRPLAGVFVLATAIALTLAGCTSSTIGQTVSVRVSGGLDTVAGDNGRPIVLVAGLLGVPPAVFRKAFSGVTPANPGVGPTVEQAQANKAALLSVLTPYGISNDQLDHASNTYRYDEGAGQTWPHTVATAVAIVSNGVVTAILVTSGGSGYTSAPTITLSDGRTATATLVYGKNVATNGSIASITLA